MSQLTAADVIWAPPMAGSIVIRPCGPTSMEPRPLWLVYDRGEAVMIKESQHDAIQWHYCHIASRRSAWR